MIEAADPVPIQSKKKTISALFPYAVWQERGGQRHEVFHTFLRAARASRMGEFLWGQPGMLNVFWKSPVPMKRVVVLVSPHLSQFVFGLVSEEWAAAASVVPYDDEIGRSVVTILLRPAHRGCQRPRIPVGMWSWLNKRPSLLPPGFTTLHRGGSWDVVQTVRALGDIETLTSCLYLIWSECNVISPEDLEKTCASIREDFSGIWVGYHRKDLLRRLDHILRQLGQGLGYLRRYEPTLRKGDVRQMKSGYGQLKQVLLEVDGEAADELIRRSPKLAILFCLLNRVDRLRTPLDIHVRDSPPMPVVTRFRIISPFFPRPTIVPHQSTSILPTLPAFITHLLVVSSTRGTMQRRSGCHHRVVVAS